ncbi:toxin-activating lysine-acyltransferase [Pseudooceanicola sp. MF1-13]|uniref:toxin-activating lysine-acyltransferase n=1 Tax=Pseudooceanicola sp. MF1-13 TaxID=3379095 RepID=UPI0038929879
MTKKSDSSKNGTETPTPPLNEAEVAEKIAKLRAQVRESFGKVVMAMMTQPRYRHQTLSDLQHLVLEPLTVDRIAMAYTKDAGGPSGDMAGMAIWASVSEEVDLKIRDQIKAGVYPIRLKPNEWVSGNINWLLDVIAIDQKTTGSVIANFQQVIKDGELRLHPIITRLVDADTLERIQKHQKADAEA